MYAEHAEVAVKADATVFHLKLEISIKDSESGTILVRGQKFECNIPMPATYGSYQSRRTRSENLALEQYAEKLRAEIDTNRLLSRRLSGVDWVLFSKTISITEK